IAVTVLCVHFRKRFPFLLVGWLWFLGTLVPVIGLVQVGSQSMADRYMYIPSIGLFMALIWMSAELTANTIRGRTMLAGVGLAALVACVALTRLQVGYWQNGLTLSRHGVADDPNNYLAWNSLAVALDDSGKPDEALTAGIKAVNLQPNFFESQFNLAVLLSKRGDLPDAAVHFELACKGNPGWANAAHALGNTYAKLGELDKAADQLRTAAKLAPKDPEAHGDLGTVLLHQGKCREAANELSDALRLKPDYAAAQRNLGVALARLGNPKEASLHFQKAAQLAPGDGDVRFDLALSLLESRQWARAETQLAEGERLRPKEARFPYRRAVALSHLHRTSEAISEYRKAIQLYPDFPDALNELAWILATSPDAKFRSGTEAVLLAEKACDLTHRKEAKELTTLAAAYAESGRFGEAVQTAKTAADLARKEGQQKFAVQADQWTQAYQSGRPARETL
ncbi:MAG TPA: tetratricopeptide repeat protein, partial [Verrucomicrobiae bacterium]|nr:tetratricopeptide repeat protein [Verrucomicrobiae bacterium]